MNFQIIHPKYGLVATERSFGTIIFKTLEPDFIFSCQFRDKINKNIRKVSGPVAVVDRNNLEIVVIIDYFDFSFNYNEDIKISISISEYSNSFKENVLYTMFLFSEYEYQIDMYQVEDLKDKDIPYFSFIDIIEREIGTIILKEFDNKINDLQELKVFPSISVSQSINLMSSIVIAENVNSEIRIFVDFTKPGNSYIANKFRETFLENVSDQIAVLVVTLISSYLDNMLETNKEYKIFPSINLN